MKNLILVSILLLKFISTKPREYYTLLGVKSNATGKEIKKAFKKLSKKYHPDISKEDDAAEVYPKITEAYDVLSDDKKRKIYDQYGKEGLDKQAQRGGGGGMDPFDLFGSFFGGGGRRGRGEDEEIQGDPLIIPLYVSLEDIFTGAKLKIMMTKNSICSHCRGSGADDPDDVETCNKCDGRGFVVERVQVAPGFIQQSQNICPKCHGKGKIIKHKCSVCNGKKVLKDLETYQIEIEEGMKYEEQIILSSSAGDYIDKTSSDLIFVLKEKPHPFYKRKNHYDLEAKVEISLKEALLGFHKKLKHLDGRLIDFKQEGITQPNQIFKLTRKGLPHQHYTADKGDLFIECVVKMPEELDDRQNELFEQFFELF